MRKTARAMRPFWFDFCGSHEMTDEIVIDVPSAFAETAVIGPRRWQELQEEATRDPVAFWRAHGRRIDWITPYTQVRDVSYDPSDLHIRWYANGSLNASFNCL